MSKSARVYNRSLSSLHSTPDQLQQYSAGRVCDNRKIVNLENEVAELVEMHWFKCKLSLQIYQNLLEFTIGPWVPSTRLLTTYNSILREGHHVSLIISIEEQCCKRSLKVTFVVRNQSGSISTVSLTLRIVSIWFEPSSNCRSCSLIVLGRVVFKKTVVDNVKVTDVWTTSGRGKSHKR